MKLTSILIGGILILSIVLALSGCSSSKSTATVQPTAKTPAAAYSQPATTTQVADPIPPSGYVLVKSANGNVTIFVPSGWNTNDTQLYPGSIIGVGDDTDKIYLIVTGEN